MEFMLAEQNLPFSIAIALMAIIGLFEGLASVLGFGISSVLDNLLPDIDIDIDAPQAQGGLSKVLGWLHVGRVPALILLIVALTAFGVVGYSIQALTHSVTGNLLPSLIAAPLALFCALPVIRVLGGWLSKIVIRDETEVVSRSSFVGRVATITLGEAKQGSPAEAKFRDEHGTTHYLMVEPDHIDETFVAGESVLLVSDSGSVMRAIKPNNLHLKD